MTHEEAFNTRKDLEERIGPLKEARISALRPARGWLRAVRDAIDLSQEAVAKKLRTKRQSYAQLETAEERGSISLASLQRAAEAMGCELVYFIVPRETVARDYGELAQVHDSAFERLQANKSSMPPAGRSAGDLTEGRFID